MPLPLNDKKWPPEGSAPINTKLAEWSAWYAGDPDELGAYYRATEPTANGINRPAQYRGGVIGAVARMWWGRPVDTPNGGRSGQLHVPLAADIAQASSDLLYSEAPELIIGEDVAAGDTKTANPTQQRLDELFDEGAHTTLASGAEVGAALGGRYHRVTWDKAVVPDRPFLTTVDADAAWPEFTYGVLTAVTFWWVLSKEGSVWLRHLERHELDGEGNGLVQHGLYQGSAGQLGIPVPLDYHESTAPLANAIDEEGYVKEGRSEGLLAEYIPNALPNRRWRGHATGRYLGRADVDGVEGELDALDEAYSSWMRDLRLAKSRILIPEYMMNVGAPGGGSSFDTDREVYVPIRSAAPEDGDATITMNQFDIRVEQHQATCQELTEVILRHAGYSSQTFGESEGGAAVTATEILSRERRSYLTSGRKKRIEGPAVARLLRKLLTIDKEVFGNNKIEPDLPQVIFGDAVRESVLTLAQTTLAMDQARAASTRTRVALLHPDWDDTAVEEEAKAIIEEQGSSAPDPFTFQG